MKFMKYFGTDGMRGKVGEIPITPEFILRLGWTVGKVLSYHNVSGSVIIGRDTRISGRMLESALESGLLSSGISSIFVGHMPTPAVAYLTKTFKEAMGIVISASHNHYYDNGIKFFTSEGTKLSYKMEEEIENCLINDLVCGNILNFVEKNNQILDVSGRYIEFCKSTFPRCFTLAGLTIVLDCANGSTYHIAPHVFRELGAKVITIGCCPDGVNINHKCGTTDISQLQSKVLQEHADIGIAYDGDGDRVIMTDHCGNKVDGDKILYVIAQEQLKQSKLVGGVVGTFMSNMGLVLALQRLGIPFIQSQVGDRYIIEMLKRKGWRIGAENSGHVILLDQATTGDGIVASLQVLSSMFSSQMTLYDLCKDLYLLPQILLNVDCSGCGDPLQSYVVKQVYQDVECQLLGRGRVLLRKSGTEPYIRVMVEGDDLREISDLGNQIVAAIKSV